MGLCKPIQWILVVEDVSVQIIDVDPLQYLNLLMNSSKRLCGVTVKHKMDPCFQQTLKK
ncbi:hypothetical protein Smp_186660 [Schistosoma mansoni]|uniref:hypothetical protein n=1 Tax=Schistosoma mansoni TaxID=6183 RepID=UPI0001A626C3|nr:hypothetical protein Smp_186660 [Schistosoma mansoni]|eukprot:XP_018649982.1 hypothetical protein Smp_186660 [Schistosoma mansoni]